MLKRILNAAMLGLALGAPLIVAAQVEQIPCDYDRASGVLTCPGLETPAPACPSPTPCPECPPPASPCPSPSATPTPTPDPPSPTPTPVPTPSPSPTTTPEPRSTWVDAYYAGYFWDWHDDQQTALAAVDMTTMTHLIFARYAPGGGSLGGQCGGVLQGAGTGHQFVETQLIAKAKAAGVRALMMVGGVGDGPGFDCSTADPAVRAHFVTNIVGLLNAKGYDGVDVDWEENLSTAAQRTQVLALLEELREAKPGIIITWPAFWGNINFKTVTPWHVQVAAAVDHYNLMTYSMAGTWPGWDSWHHSALLDATPTHPTSIESSVAEYVAAGVPKEKLGIGIGLYGIYYDSGPVTGPRQLLGVSGANSGDDENNYRRLWNEQAFSQPNGTRVWDDTAKQAYMTYSPPWLRYGTRPIGFLSYEDEESIAAKGAWVKANGVGGTLVWVTNYGVTTGTQNPLMDAVRAAFLGGPQPSPTPVPTPIPTPVPTPTPTPSVPPTPPPPPGTYVGYGAVTKGGAGGDVYMVSSLLDSGPFTLRDAIVNRTGPRYITCGIGFLGKIKLASDIKIRMPYLTIDFEPCPGLTIEQPNVSTPALKIVATHDVIIHGVRSAGVWKPTGPGAGLNDAGTLSVDGDGAPNSVPWDQNPTICWPQDPSYRRRSCRIVIDQVTLSGAADDGPDFWCGISDVTISRSFILDSYHPRSNGCKGVYGEAHQHARHRITEFANVYAYNGERTPKLTEGVYDYDMVNNIVAFWQDYGTFAGKGQGGYGSMWDDDGAQDRHNVVGNVWLPESEPGSTQEQLCKADLTGMGRCRRAWDCVWGDTPKNNNEVDLRADTLHYSKNVFGPWHGSLNSVECVSTLKGKNPIARSYTLTVQPTSSSAAMEQVLDGAGVRQRTRREAEVVEAVRRALRLRLAN